MPLAVLLVAVCILGLADQQFVAVLAWDRSRLADGELWRLFTGHLVHANLPHLLMNLAGLGLAVLVFGSTLNARTWWVLMIVSSLCVSGGLLLTGTWPETYVGLSGVLYALFATPLVVSLGRSNRAAIALFVGLWAKVAFETYHGASAATEAMIALPVATMAHLFGAVSGTIVGMWVRFVTAEQCKS